MYPFGAPGSLVLGPDGGGMIPPVPMEQPKPLFRYGEQTIWSSQMHLGTAALANQSFRLFATPVGQVGQGFTNSLSIAETNLKEGGRVPSGVAYDVFGIAVQLLHHTAATDTAAQNGACDTDAAISDLINILDNGVLSWDFTQTQVDIAPVMLIGQGGGAFGAVSTTQNATDRGHMNNSAGAIWLYRKHPVALPGSSTFATVLRYGSRAPVIGANAVVIRVVLLGYYKNVIEIG
jgi:hypothetical protein